MTTRRTSTEWARIIKRFRKSGLTQREFCEREQLSLSALRNWLYTPNEPRGFVEVLRSPVNAIGTRRATIRVEHVELSVDIDDAARVMIEVVDGLRHRDAAR